MKKAARRLKSQIRMMFSTWSCRLDTVPPVDGYSDTRSGALEAAILKAKAAGHNILIRRRHPYVIE